MACKYCGGCIHESMHNPKCGADGVGCRFRTAKLQLEAVGNGNKQELTITR